MHSFHFEGQNENNLIKQMLVNSKCLNHLYLYNRWYPDDEHRCDVNTVTHFALFVLSMGLRQPG